MNPNYVIRCLETFCSIADEIIMRVMTFVPENRQLLRIAEIIHPLLVEKIESSGVLAKYEHSVEFIHASTRLQIADIAHSRQDFYEGIITMDNVDDILSRLPAALSDFENFEFHFPEFASCWDSTR